MLKVIIVGASSGIGKALALQLAGIGYRTAITGRRAKELEAIKQMNPDSFVTSCFDCTRSDNDRELAAIVEQLGGLDLLVISAGTGDLNEQLDPAIENHTNHLNVLAFTEIADWAFNYFCKQGYGQLVAITSIAGLRGNKMAPAYGASKAYQISYMEGLRQKAHGHQKRIIITDIRPGFVDTDMAKGPGQFWVANPEKAARQILKHIGNKRSVAYVTHRWRLFALLMKWMPGTLYKRF